MNLNYRTNYKTLLMMIGLISMLMPMHLAIAKTVDNLSIGDKDKTVFINTDQVMIKDGAVITNLDAVQEAFNTSKDPCITPKTIIKI